MLFWLKKAATLPFLPLYLSMISGLVGLVLIRATRHERLGRTLLTVGVLVLLIFSNQGVATLLIRPLESFYPPIPDVRSAVELPKDVFECTAIVVLGGGHADEPSRSRVVQLSTASMGRVGEAVRLYRLLPATKFIVSGHHIKDLSHAQVLGEAAVSLGVDPARVIRMDNPRDTEDEINNLAKIVGGAPVAIVTSAWHMPRTMQLCRAIGVRGVPCPVNFISGSSSNVPARFLSWNLEALEASTKAIREYLGATWLRLRGK